MNSLVRYNISRSSIVQLAGSSNQVVRILPSSSESSARVHVGYSATTGTQDHRGVLRIHYYRSTTTSYNGQLVTIESASGGRYLTVTSNTQPTLEASANSVHPSCVTILDSRFFELFVDNNDGISKLKNIVTDKFLSHGTGQLTLVDQSDENNARGDLNFDVFAHTQS